MRKLMSLLIAISFFLMSVGSALASEPINEPWDRHAVWTKNYDQQDIRDGTDWSPGAMDEARGESSSGDSESMEMKSGDSGFDFVQETKFYDFSKDQNDSA
ncbi:MAG: hypothetical protein G3M78_06880 [Candidatus Nitrohelix vancouverensis]|uniref:Uncharacterized protein n=1 Tax=Candidatus Nitrohelix vancouverensis TaxID=2705534 RepID=A0A7T0C232_9BACT|nr:MAG: hypothetical protein G3M78_06880 [Candidatus Nitrohelix vancouverensis]